MTHQRNTDFDVGHPMVCDIKIKGHLGPHWIDWFAGMAITLEDNGQTRLTGTIVDQAALLALLRMMRDAGMPLLAIVCMQPDEAEASDNNQVNDPFEANLEEIRGRTFCD